MESKSFVVSLNDNPMISMRVIPGHFATNRFHASHYLDVSDMKTNALSAREAARELAMPYLSTTLVDTIVCMEGCEVIGAYMAEELSEEGMAEINSGGEIHVVRPIYSVDNKLIFQSNMRRFISGKNIILLVPCVSLGSTIKSAMECFDYYGGELVGISALFNAYEETVEQEIFSMFTSDDIPGDYKIYPPGNCPMCGEGKKLDAIITSEGYTVIN